MAIGVDFPMDILYNIFLFLPVKALIRFKYVCKSLYALIDSSDFIKSHLNRSIETESHYSLVYTTSKLNSLNPRQQVYFLHHYSSYIDGLPHSTKLKLPTSFGSRVRIISSCNGLICLYSCMDNHLALCNPSTRLFKPVPQPDDPFDLTRCYGFGYDCRGHDYKIVRVSTADKFMVYSLKTDSWRISKHQGKLPQGYGVHGVLVNNRLHWKPQYHDIHRVHSFDLHDEQWREVPLPNVYNGNIHKSDVFFSPLRVGVLHGCLCLVSSFVSGCHGEVCCDIWIMREYGVKESWTNVYSLGSRSNDEYISVWDVLFDNQFEGGLFMRNSQLKTKMKAIDDPHMHYPGVVKCIESLTPLMGNCCLVEEKNHNMIEEESHK